MTRPRDPRHHNCVDRQTYHACGALILGWALAGLMDWLTPPLWVVLLVLTAALAAIAVLELAWDGEERRRARLTPRDRAAGRH